MANVTQHGYLGLSVSDVDAWKRFAAETLGLQVNGWEADGAVLLRMDEPYHRLIVHPTGKDDVAYIGWEVADEQMLQAMTDRLRDAGVAVQQGTPAQAEARRVVGLIAFEAPNRIPSEAFCGPLMMRFDRPFKSPRDVLGMRLSDFVHRESAPGSRRTTAFFHCNPRQSPRGAPANAGNRALPVCGSGPPG